VSRRHVGCVERVARAAEVCDTAAMRAIRTLVSSIVDYAGLYPPASLDEPTVVSNFAAIHGSHRAWMLGRIVWPAARLERLSELAAGAAPVAEPPETEGAWPVTALLGDAGTPDFSRTIELVRSFNDRHEQPGAAAMRVDSVEFKCADPLTVDAALDALPEDIWPYVEIPLDSDPRGMIAAISGVEASAKFRTGGVTAAAHPTTRALATAIVACAQVGVAFKATAGLHRAMRHWNAAANAHQFGFLSLFIGACLVYARKIDAEGLAAMLEDADPSGFDISDNAIAWQGARIVTREIEAARERFAHSFGSCSFDEPWDDLTALELLPAAGQAS
jgi:hypothetical protein